MGFLRTITLYNDFWHENRIQEEPTEFVALLVETMRRSSQHHIPYNLSGIKVHPSRHADDHTVFVHRGNTVHDITHRTFDEMSLPMQRDILRTAQSLVTYAKKRIKEREIVLAKSTKP